MDDYLNSIGQMSEEEKEAWRACSSDNESAACVLTDGIKARNAEITKLRAALEATVVAQGTKIIELRALLRDVVEAEVSSLLELLKDIKDEDDKGYYDGLSAELLKRIDAALGEKP